MRKRVQKSALHLVEAQKLVDVLCGTPLVLIFSSSYQVETQDLDQIDLQGSEGGCWVHSPNHHRQALRVTSFFLVSSELEGPDGK